MADLGFNIDITEAKKSILEIAKGFENVKAAAVEFDKTAQKTFNETAKDAEKPNKPLKEQIGIIEKLEDRHKRLQAQLKKATSEKTIEVLNKKLQETSKEMKRLSEVGVKSFDDVNKKVDETSAIFENLKGAAIAAFSVQALLQFSTMLKDITDRTDKVTSSVQNYFKGTNEEINKISRSVFTMSSVLAQDEQTIARTANALSKGFGEEGVKATTLMQEALYKAGGEAEELLSWFQEYPANMKESSLSLENFLAIAVQSSKAGVFSDYGISTIEEGLIRLREMTPATQDALKAIGLQPVDVQKLIDEKGVFAAIQQVSAKLKTLEPDSQKVGQAIADIFGGAGEKAGYEYITFLSEMKLSLADVEDNATELTKSKREFAELIADISFSATESGSAINSVYTGIVKGINFVLRYIKELFDNSKPLTDVFKGLFSTIGNVFSQIVKLAEKLGLVNTQSDAAKNTISKLTIVFQTIITPIQNAIELVLYLVESLNKFIDNSPNVQKAIGFISDAFASFNSFLQNTPAYLTGFFEAGKTAFTGLADVAISQFTAIGDVVSGVFTFDAAKIKKGIDTSKKGFSDYGKAVAEAFNNSFAKTQKAIDVNTNEPTATKTKTPVKDPVKPVADLEKMKIDAMKDGLEKRLALIEYEYAERIKKAKQFNIDTLALEQERNAKIKEEIKKNTEAEDRQYIDRKIILSGIDTNKQIIKLKEQANKEVSKLNKEAEAQDSGSWFDFEEMKSAAYAVGDLFQVIADKRLEAANKQVDAANKEVESRQNAVDKLKSDLELELQLNQQGFASNVALKQAELAEAKKRQLEAEKQQQEALKQQEAAQKYKERIDKATQVSNILVAVSELIRTWSKLGPFGHIAGIAQIGVMLAALSSTKKKVNKLRKGKTGILVGPSHEQGGIPIAPGYEAEGGEYLSVTPVQQTKEYLPLLESIRLNDKNAMYKQFRKIFPFEKTAKKESISFKFESLERDVKDIKNILREKKHSLSDNKQVSFNKSNKITIRK